MIKGIDNEVEGSEYSLFDFEVDGVEIYKLCVAN